MGIPPAVGGRPGADQVQRPQPAGAVEGPPQGLAVDGDDRALRRLGRLPGASEPIDQAGLQRLWADGLKDAPEGVVRGDAVGEFEEAAEEVLLEPGELLDLNEVIA